MTSIKSLKVYTVQVRNRFKGLDRVPHELWMEVHDIVQETGIRPSPKKDVLFIIGDWNAKVRRQEIPGVTSKFGLGIQNEAG